MKKYFVQLKNSFVSGLLFLLPVFIVLVLLSKVFQFFKGFSARIAGIFGLNSIPGFSGTTFVSVVGFILLTILCGFLIRFAFLKRARDWLDRSLSSNIPAYKMYREMAEAKLIDKEKAPEFYAAVYQDGNNEVPCLIAISSQMEKASVLFPAVEPGGKSEIRIVPAQSIRKFEAVNADAWKSAIKKGGVGLLELMPSK